MKGQHFILDAECQEQVKLLDKQLVGKLLTEIPAIIGMNTLTHPLIVQGAEHNPGLTGVIIMETSNIVFHTFTKDNKFSLDIFSIKPINGEKVLTYLENLFNFNIIRKDLAERL